MVTIARSHFSRSISLIAAGLAAGAALAFAVPAVAQTSPTTPDIQVRVEDAKSSAGARDVVCRGQREPKPTLRCEIRFEQATDVVGADVVDRASRRQWTASFRPDDTAFVIMIDRGTGLARATIQRAVTDLVEVFGRLRSRQQVVVAAYAATFDVLQESTTDANTVTAAIRRVGGPTNARSELYRISLEGIKRLEGVTAGRKVLLIVGDGRSADTAFRHEDVVTAARNAGVRILTVGYVDTGAVDSGNLQRLQRLSEDTGGAYFRAANATELANFKSTALTRFGSGGTLEAEAPNRDLPTAVEVTLRHPDNRTTQFTGNWTDRPVTDPRCAQPNPPSECMQNFGEQSIFDRVYEIVRAWIADNIYLAAGIAAAVVVVVALGVVFALTRPRKAVAPAYVAPAFEAASFEAAPSTSGSAAPRPPDNDAWSTAVAADAAPASVPEPETELFARAESEERETSIRRVTPPTESPAIAWLEFNGKPGRIAVRKKRVTIGRQSDNDIVTDPNEDTVSRQHVVITVNVSGRFQLVNKSIETRNPPNPIFVNDRECEHAELADGDIVKLGTGSYGFVFREVRDQK